MDEKAPLDEKESVDQSFAYNAPKFCSNDRKEQAKIQPEPIRSSKNEDSGKCTTDLERDNFWTKTGVEPGETLELS